MLTSTLSSRRLETLMEESLVDTLMLTPTESSNRFSILLMEQDSVLLTLVSPLLPHLTQSPLLLLPSILSLLLLPPSTQSFPLPQCTLVLLLNQLLTPLRLLKLRLLTLLSLLPLPPLRGRDVRLMLLFLEELPESSLLPPPSSTTPQCVPMLPILMPVSVTTVLVMLVLVTMVLVIMVLGMLGSICKAHFKFYLKDSGVSSLRCM